MAGAGLRLFIQGTKPISSGCRISSENNLFILIEMRIFKCLLITLILFIAFTSNGQQVAGLYSGRADGIYAEFATNKGIITVMLDYRRAPVTVANFIGLSEGTITNSTYSLGKPFYSGSIWHRVVPGHVIQGGEPSVIKDPANYEASSTGYEIPNEITDLSHNKAGMIGMANSGPNTNTCQYYITLADRSYLDGNYTLFGEVVSGIDVVNKIVKGDTTFSITITRIGDDAGRFIVNNVVFKKLLDAQWKKVNSEKEKRRMMEEKYISENYPGLTSLPDGLRYRILAEGKGTPVPGSELEVSYIGRLISGPGFASSADGGKPEPGSDPVPFKYLPGKSSLIKGLQEALKDMTIGEKRLVIVPPELAYGINTGFYGKEISGQKRFVISPGETLVIEVTLLKFH
jgi:cyclophilin family peptidyl-prolyl cis-trans isomerase